MYPSDSKGTSAESADHIQLETKSKLTVVLNFAGERTDFPTDVQQKILDVVRIITANSEIEIIGTEIGSFHILLAIDDKDLEHLRSAELREAISQ